MFDKPNKLINPRKWDIVCFFLPGLSFEVKVIVRYDLNYFGMHCIIFNYWSIEVTTFFFSKCIKYVLLSNYCGIVFRATVRVLLYLNSSVNVFIYAGRLSEFRVRIKSDLRQYFGICMHFKKTKPLKKIQTDINLVSSLSKITINDTTVDTEQLK